MKQISRLTTLILLASTLVLVSCQTNSITGRKQLMIFSDKQAAQQSALSYKKVISQASKQKVLNRDRREVKRVRAITNRLIPAAILLRSDAKNWKWEVNVLEDKSVNAWCMAGGKMAVYTGLIDTIKPSDHELAVVMGHEISHALLSHQSEKMSRMTAQKGALQIGVLAGQIAGVDLRSAAGIADTVAQLGLQLPNGRMAETEADRIGLQISASAGYDPRAAVTLWQKMSKSGKSAPEWLSTHPSNETRINNLRKLAEELMPVYHNARKGK